MRLARNAAGPEDVPKSLGNPTHRAARIARLQEPHVRPLTCFVDTIREETGYGTAIPYFDPADGGVKALCLFLLEAPGPKAVGSGFISRNNPDERAKNFFYLNEDAGLHRELTVSWNIVPWYIGSGRKIRPALGKDVQRGMKYLEQLLGLVPDFRVVVLIGRKAQGADSWFRSHSPKLRIVNAPHPSPLFINNAKHNRGLILEPLRQVAEYLAHAA